MPTTVYSVTSA